MMRESHPEAYTLEVASQLTIDKMGPSCFLIFFTKVKYFVS